MAFVSLLLEQSLSAQESANRVLAWEENALKSSKSSSCSQNRAPLGNFEELQTKKRRSSDEDFCTGPEGPAGPQGPAGPLGPPGATGSSGVSAAYGSFFTQQTVYEVFGYTSPSQDLILPSQTTVLPLQTSPNFVSRHAWLSKGMVKLDQPGDYFVEFGAGQSNPGSNQQVALSLNQSAIPVPGTTITLLGNKSSTSYSLTTISTIVRILDSQATLAIILINNPNSSFILGNNTDGLDVTAFLTVHKLNDIPTR